MNETPRFQVRHRGTVFWVVERVGEKWQPLAGHYQSRESAESYIDTRTAQLAHTS